MPRQSNDKPLDAMHESFVFEHSILTLMTISPAKNPRMLPIVGHCSPLKADNDGIIPIRALYPTNPIG